MPDLDGIIRRLCEENQSLLRRVQQAETQEDRKEMIRVQKRLAELAPLMDLLQELDRLRESILYAQTVEDPELKALAEEEAQEARAGLPAVEQRVLSLLVPEDPDDERDVILEVRAGAGGEEAALFAAGLLKMYLRYAEDKGWKTELLSSSPAAVGGLKEAACRIRGNGVYGRLKFESGVHRVQRIPATENKGRVHTSTATVAILPEAEEVDIAIRTEDLRVDTYRASGAGGQHVNKTESAVRITHLPTGLVVACQTERSQQRNRALAISMLRSRLYALRKEKLQRERGDLRSLQVGSADRSEKIRTYNFPQDRITDHRINQNFSNIPAILEGDLDPLFEALRSRDREDALIESGKAQERTA